MARKKAAPKQPGQRSRAQASQSLTEDQLVVNQPRYADLYPRNATHWEIFEANQIGEELGALAKLVRNRCNEFGFPSDWPELDRMLSRYDGRARKAPKNLFKVWRAWYAIEDTKRVYRNRETIDGRDRTTTALTEARELVNALSKSKGGKAPKRLPGIWQRVLELLNANPKITANQAWESFPEDTPGGHENEGLIYRSVTRNKKGKFVAVLVEVDDRTGKEDRVTYDTFRGYLKAARKDPST